MIVFTYALVLLGACTADSLLFKLIDRIEGRP